MIIYPSVKRNTHAPVAQLDRVTDYESVGQGFESLPAYQKSGCPVRGDRFFIMSKVGLEQSNAIVQWTIACRRSRRRQHHNFLPQRGENVNESLPACIGTGCGRVPVYSDVPRRGVDDHTVDFSKCMDTFAVSIFFTQSCNVFPISQSNK